MDNQIIGGLLEVTRKHLCESSVLVVAMNHRQISLTVLARGEIHDISNSDIDNAQEPLILLLEFLLVEYLYRKYAFFRGTPRNRVSIAFLSRVHLTHKSKLSFQYGFNVLLITVVVLVCSPPRVATAKGSGNPVNCCQCSFFWSMMSDAYGIHHACKVHQPQLLCDVSIRSWLRRCRG